MKKRFAFLLLVLSLFTCLFSACGSKDAINPSEEIESSQDGETSEVTQEPIIVIPENCERVTALTYYTDSLSEQNYLLEEISYDYEMDEVGNIIKMKVHNKRYKQPTEYSFKYLYFADGKVQRIMMYCKDDNEEILLYENEYDENGLLLKHEEYSLLSKGQVSDTITYEYNEFGMLKKKEQSGSGTFVVYYDDFGRISKTYLPGARPSERECSYVYETEVTENGKREYQCEDDANGMVVYTRDYDSNGNLIKLYNEDIEEVYRYDESGNLLTENVAYVNFNGYVESEDYSYSYIIVANWKYIKPLLEIQWK